MGVAALNRVTSVCKKSFSHMSVCLPCAGGIRYRQQAGERAAFIF